MTSNYIPGVCNINPQEIKKRRLTGHVGLLVAVTLTTLIFLYDTPFMTSLLFIAIFASAFGYLQAANRFCVAYATQKNQHADDEVSNVVDQEAQAADAKKAQHITLRAFIIAFLATIVVSTAAYLVQ